MMQSIPGRPGAYFQSVEEDVLVVPVDITLKATTDEEYNDLLKKVKQWLLTKEPKTLSLDKEPGMYYEAIIEKTSYDELVRVGKAQVQFICPDGYKYSEERSQVIHDPENPGAANSVVENQGSMAVKPKYKVTFLSPSTYLAIATQNQFFMIGTPFDFEQAPIDTSPVVLFDDMGDLSKWSTTGLVDVDGGEVSSTFKTDGKLFFVTSYGTGSKWHGPGGRQDLPQPIQDFRVEVRFELRLSTIEEIGRIELYLIADDGSVLGKLAIKDVYAHSNDEIGEARIGDLDSGHMVLKGHGYREGSYNNDVTRLLLIREGTTIKAQIGEVTPNGEFANRMNGTFKDVGGLFQKKLAAVQIHAARMSGEDYPEQTFIHEIKIEELLPHATAEVPYIGKPGDVMDIDPNKSKILVNGSEWLANGRQAYSLKDITTDFFPLKTGLNSLIVGPADAARVEVYYRERWN